MFLYIGIFVVWLVFFFLWKQTRSAAMRRRERYDYAILMLTFLGMLVGITSFIMSHYEQKKAEQAVLEKLERSNELLEALLIKE